MDLHYLKGEKRKEWKMWQERQSLTIKQKQNERKSILKVAFLGSPFFPKRSKICTMGTFRNKEIMCSQLFWLSFELPACKCHHLYGCFKLAEPSCLDHRCFKINKSSLAIQELLLSHPHYSGALILELSILNNKISSMLLICFESLQTRTRPMCLFRRKIFHSFFETQL